MTLQRPDGSEFSAVVGQGFDNTELIENTSALHDLTVGLMLFDLVHVPLSHVSTLHDLLGSEVFWVLVRANVFRFIFFHSEPAACFPTSDYAVGSIGMVARRDAEGNLVTVDGEIRRQLKPAGGQESEAEKLFGILKSHTIEFDDARFHVPNLTRGALLHPSVQQLLGISDAVSPANIPRWVVFPALRLAHTIRVGCACEDFALPATKIGFGGEILVGAAFGLAGARDWADSVASYVLTTRFNTELGAFVALNPGRFFAEMLAFRDTKAGIDLRREILEELATHAGSEFVASVNAGLRRLVPTSVMDSARNQLSGLLFGEASYPVVPAVWTNVRNSGSVAQRWRARSRRPLEEHCSRHRIGPNDLCPCGSGEKLRFCCASAVQT